jgi:cytochrome b6-f complex iron-sulfur subunit
MNDLSESTEERRDFLAGAAFWTTVGTLGFAAIGIARMPKPGVFPGQSSVLKIGTPGEYPVSAEPQRVPGQNLFILHDAEGFAAISAICSHLGCIVAPTGSGFACPCHGSKFAADGRVTQGPAPSPLMWYELSLAPDGQIVIDTKKTVPVGTKFALS